MECVLTDLGTQCGFPVDVKYKSRVVFILNAIADDDPMLLDVCRLKRSNECLTSCTVKYTPSSQHDQTTLQGAATSQTYWHDPIVIACLFLKFPDNRCNRFPALLRDTNIVTVLHTQTTENNLAELLLLREVLPLMGQVLPLLREVLSLLRDTNIVTVLHTHSVFFVDDNENDDENDEIVSNFRRRD